jgi:hypothetical protein
MLWFLGLQGSPFFLKSSHAASASSSAGITASPPISIRAEASSRIAIVVVLFILVLVLSQILPGVIFCILEDIGRIKIQKEVIG